VFSRISLLTPRSSLTELSHLAEVDGGDCVVNPGLLHLGHLLPLSSAGDILQYVIVLYVGVQIIRLAACHQNPVVNRGTPQIQPGRWKLA